MIPRKIAGEPVLQRCREMRADPPPRATSDLTFKPRNQRREKQLTTFFGGIRIIYTSYLAPCYYCSSTGYCSYVYLADGLGNAPALIVNIDINTSLSILGTAVLLLRRLELGGGRAGTVFRESVLLAEPKRGLE